MQRMIGLVRRCIEDYRMIEPGDPELREKIRRLRIVFFSVREYNADVF